MSSKSKKSLKSKEKNEKVHFSSGGTAPIQVSIIKGKADLGTQGIKPFQCNFDNKGKFSDEISLVNEGSL